MEFGQFEKEKIAQLANINNNLSEIIIQLRELIKLKEIELNKPL
jgi:hypothetical protein